MPYQNLPSRAIPYHTDGSVVKLVHINNGVVKSLNATEMAELNDEDYVYAISSMAVSHYLVLFFPELRTVAGLYFISYAGGYNGPVTVQGSADSTNGLDGTWESANAPQGYNDTALEYDDWRKKVKPISFSGSIRVLRVRPTGVEQKIDRPVVCHVYGVKASGQTPDDILFLDAEAADAEFTALLDFADRPAGTSVQRQIKIQNASTTKTANNINLYVEDPADIIRIAWSNAGPWQTTLNIASLAVGAKSNVIYVKCETPAPPTPLGPKRAPIHVAVGSWT